MKNGKAFVSRLSPCLLAIYLTIVFTLQTACYDIPLTLPFWILLCGLAAGCTKLAFSLLADRFDRLVIDCEETRHSALGGYSLRSPLPFLWYT